MQRQHIDFQANANVGNNVFIVGYAIFRKRFVWIYYGARPHVDERGFNGAIRVQVRRIKLLKNGGNDIMGCVLVRIYWHLVVAVSGIVQVEIYLHALSLA